MNKVTLKTDTQTGDVIAVILRTSSVWYHVSPNFVRETVRMKFCPSVFKEAVEKLDRIEKR